MVLRIPSDECRIDLKRSDKSLKALVEKMEQGKHLGGYEFYDPKVRGDLVEHEKLLKKAIKLAEKAGALIESKECLSGPCSECGNRQACDEELKNIALLNGAGG